MAFCGLKLVLFFLLSPFLSICPSFCFETRSHYVARIGLNFQFSCFSLLSTRMEDAFHQYPAQGCFQKYFSVLITSPKEENVAQTYKLSRVSGIPGSLLQGFSNTILKKNISAATTGDRNGTKRPTLCKSILHLASSVGRLPTQKNLEQEPRD